MAADSMTSSSRTILIGVEDTAEGRDALTLGALLAATLSAQPLVAMVLPYPHYLMGHEDLEHALAHDTREMFALARDQLSSLEVRTQAVAESSPAAALYALAEEEKAIAVVVGSTHRGALGRVYPGSVGANLLHGAPCAVVVAPRAYTQSEEHRLRSVGVAFDGSPEGFAALESAIGIAQRVRASLRLITAIRPPRYGYGEALEVLSAGEAHTGRQAEGRKILDLGLERVPDGMPVDGRLINGEAAEAIIEASQGLDLLLLGSRGYGPVRRTLLGSVATGVTNSAPCPVLVLPRAAGMDPLGVAAG
jgi:nucleotide-binding universal stress UspA family protein